MGEQGKIFCRLDRFYVSKNLLNHVIYCDHKPVSRAISDHSLVYVTLNLNDIDCVLSPGFWKCNVSILGDDNLRKI